MSNRIVNKKAFDEIGIKYREYTNWCKLHKLRHYSSSSKKLFFNNYYDGKIVIKDGKIVGDDYGI